MRRHANIVKWPGARTAVDQVFFHRLQPQDAFFSRGFRRRETRGSTTRAKPPGPEENPRCSWRGYNRWDLDQVFLGEWFVRV